MKKNLWDASRCGDLKTVKLLLAAGESVENLNRDGLAPHHVAALSGNVSVVSLLLEYGANVNALDSQGFSVLQNAIMGGKITPKTRLELVELLLEAGADPNHEAMHAGTILNTAINYRRSQKIIDVLLRYGAK